MQLVTYWLDLYKASGWWRYKLEGWTEDFSWIPISILKCSKYNQLCGDLNASHDKFLVTTSCQLFAVQLCLFVYVMVGTHQESRRKSPKIIVTAWTAVPSYWQAGTNCRSNIFLPGQWRSLSTADRWFSPGYGRRAGGCSYVRSL